jgi:cytochrome c oxidase subunit II
MIARSYFPALRSRFGVRFAAPWICVGVWLLAPCACFATGPSPVPNIFKPESTPAHAIYRLSNFVNIICALIFIVVSSLLVYAVIKFRHRGASDDREPPPVYGSNQIEIAWTVIPCLIVLVLFLATARMIHSIQNAPAPPSAVQVIAVGHQYWWEFRYPELGVVTANELHVPSSVPANSSPTFLKLLSADTDHSFWVPQLAGKTDLIPNRVNNIWIDPQATGMYVGQCAQFCGVQHAKMLLRVYVDTPEQFREWVAHQKQNAVADDSVVAGRRIFESTACINCHAVAGTVANGRFGPDLTHLMSRDTLASGAADNTRENLKLWIRKPDALKPGSLMPAMNLSEPDLDALVSYLETLR